MTVESDDAEELEVLKPARPSETGQLAEPKHDFTKQEGVQIAIPTREIATESARDRYRARLNEIWTLAHADSTAPPERREAFTESVLGLVDIASVVGSADIPGPSETAAPISGDLSTIMLRVAGIVESSGGDAVSLETFIRGQLAATIERLEREDEGSIEDRVDIVLGAVSRMPGASGSGRLAVDLFRYLQQQKHKGPGYCATATMIAQVAGAEEGWQDSAALIYHHALKQLYRLAVDQEPLDHGGAQAVSIAATNLATLIADQLQRVRHSPPSNVIRPLKVISAAWAPSLEADRERASVLLNELLVAYEDAIESLTVLNNMGMTLAAWDLDDVRTARLAASSAVAAYLGPSPDSVPARFFNAGSALGRSKETDARYRMAELLMNALGLRWALSIGDSVLDSLVNHDGLDCAVNFLGTVVQSREQLESPVWTAIERLSLTLASLPQWEPLSLSARSSDAVFDDLTRLGNAAKRLGVKPTSFDASALESTVEAAIHALFPVERIEGDPLLDTARRVGKVFESVARRRQAACSRTRRGPSCLWPSLLLHESCQPVRMCGGRCFDQELRASLANGPL